MSSPSTSASSDGSYEPEVDPSTYYDKLLQQQPVRHKDYRLFRLGLNNVYIYTKDIADCPIHVLALLSTVGAFRFSPQPSPADVVADEQIADLAVQPFPEVFVQDIICKRLLPPLAAVLHRSDRVPMLESNVPSSKPAANCGHTVSTPAPDVLYGYSLERAFRGQDAVHVGGRALADDADMVYPFFLIEFTNECDDMWVATNECLGGTATCVNIIEQLKCRLWDKIPHDEDEIHNTAVCSLTISPTTALFYITWRTWEDTTYTKLIATYPLQDAAHWLCLRQVIQSVLG
ncbi:hypothetical protein F503_06667 [Ophiostoma piceae UAMH 11346]|uniref:DUF7924 domain-containing protein n=1 Tax=Ophiostoma piceae (strain UAMH 11346) TaxID=1262450 RepID=S3BQ80_OPHP1|nr:hypothetical protein F503_06667 [Ophiostoma piceae UAMH 11346]